MQTEKRAREVVISENFNTAIELLHQWQLDPEGLSADDLGLISQLVMEAAAILEDINNQIVIGDTAFARLTTRIDELDVAGVDVADTFTTEELLYYLCTAAIIIAVLICDNKEDLEEINLLVVRLNTDLPYENLRVINAVITTKLQQFIEKSILCMSVAERAAYLENPQSLSHDFAAKVQAEVLETQAEVQTFPGLDLLTIIKMYFDTCEIIQTVKSNKAFNNHLQIQINRAELLFAHFIYRMDNCMNFYLGRTVNLEMIDRMRKEGRGLFSIFIKASSLKIAKSNLLQICEQISKYFATCLTFVHNQLQPERLTKPNIDPLIISGELNFMYAQSTLFGRLNSFMLAMRDFVSCSLRLLQQIKTRQIRSFNNATLQSALLDLITPFLRIKVIAKPILRSAFRSHSQATLEVIDNILLTCLREMILSYSFKELTSTQLDRMLIILEPLKNVLRGKELKAFVKLLKIVEMALINFLDSEKVLIEATATTPAHEVPALQDWCESRAIYYDYLINKGSYQAEDHNRAGYPMIIGARGLLHDGRSASDVTTLEKYYGSTLDYAENILRSKHRLRG